MAHIVILYILLWSNLMNDSLNFVYLILYSTILFQWLGQCQVTVLRSSESGSMTWIDLRLTTHHVNEWIEFISVTRDHLHVDVIDSTLALCSVRIWQQDTAKSNLLVARYDSMYTEVCQQTVLTLIQFLVLSIWEKILFIHFTGIMGHIW